MINRSSGDEETPPVEPQPHLRGAGEELRGKLAMRLESDNVPMSSVGLTGNESPHLGADEGGADEDGMTDEALSGSDQSEGTLKGAPHQSPNLALSSPNIKNAAGLNSIHLVVSSGSLLGLDLLLRHTEADLDSRDSTGRTALHIACAESNSESSREGSIVARLLEAGADPNVEDADGTTPLHVAAACGSEKVVQLLLLAGAEARATTAGDTPLHLAAVGGHLGAMQLLVLWRPDFHPSPLLPPPPSSKMLPSVSVTHGGGGGDGDRSRNTRLQSLPLPLPSEGLDEPFESGVDGGGHPTDLFRELSLEGDGGGGGVEEEQEGGEEGLEEGEDGTRSTSSLITQRQQQVQQHLPGSEYLSYSSDSTSEAAAGGSQLEGDGADSGSDGEDGGGGLFDEASAEGARALFALRSEEEEEEEEEGEGVTHEYGDPHVDGGEGVYLGGGAYEEEWGHNGDEADEYGVQRPTWNKYSDEEGNVYYFDATTGQSTWEYPSSGVVVEGEETVDLGDGYTEEWTEGGADADDYTDQYEEEGGEAVVYAEDYEEEEGNPDQGGHEEEVEEAGVEAWQHTDGAYYAEDSSWAPRGMGWSEWGEQEYSEEGHPDEEVQTTQNEAAKDVGYHEGSEGEWWQKEWQEDGAWQEEEEEGEEDGDEWQAEEGEGGGYEWQEEDEGGGDEWQEEEGQEGGHEWQAEEGEEEGWGEAEYGDSGNVGEEHGESNEGAVIDDPSAPESSPSPPSDSVAAAQVSLASRDAAGAAAALAMKTSTQLTHKGEEEEDEALTVVNPQTVSSPEEFSDVPAPNEKTMDIWGKFFENALLSQHPRQRQSEVAAQAAADDDASLLEAVIGGDAQAVEKLILDGAFAASNCADQQLRTPLHYAAYNGDRDMAALLIDYDANVEATDATGNTPLHVSAARGSASTLLFLLECAVAVNAQNDAGDTPLHLAVWFGNVECIASLLNYDASLVATNTFGFDPYSNVMARSPLARRKKLPSDLRRSLALLAERMPALADRNAMHGRNHLREQRLPSSSQSPSRAATPSSSRGDDDSTERRSSRSASPPTSLSSHDLSNKQSRSSEETRHSQSSLDLSVEEEFHDAEDDEDSEDSGDPEETGPGVGSGSNHDGTIPHGSNGDASRQPSTSIVGAPLVYPGPPTDVALALAALQSAR